MSHFSPFVFLLWSVLATGLSAFYFSHLWKFDRFRCLNLMRDRQGAFKRLMTYSYMVGLSMLLTYTIGHTIIKYKEGYAVLPSGAVLPKPFELWTPQHQAAYFPLNIVWALSWGAEAVSHLEELCFWHFLIHARPSPTSWFRTTTFKVWVGGSVSAVTLVVVPTVVTKADPLKNEAWLLIMGSSVSLLITVGFIPILWVFPDFVRTARQEGADKDVVIRLAKFHDLNARLSQSLGILTLITRIISRFIFVVPPLIVGISELRPHTHESIEDTFWIDLLLVISSIGCVIQSSITLMIFFPRNFELETRRWLSNSTTLRRVAPPQAYTQSSNNLNDRSHLDTDCSGKYLLTDSPVTIKGELRTQTPGVYIMEPWLNYDDSTLGHTAWGDSQMSLDQRDIQQQQTHGSVAGSSLNMREAGLGVSQETSRMNPLALYYTSPLDRQVVTRRRAPR